MCEATIRIARCIHFHRDACCLQLCCQSVQVADAKVDHPLLRRVAKVAGLSGKGLKLVGSSLLIPHWVTFTLRSHETLR